MEFAHRYAALLNAPDGMLREAPAEEFSAHKSELELQAHWFAGDFSRFRQKTKLFSLILNDLQNIFCSGDEIL